MLPLTLRCLSKEQFEMLLGSDTFRFPIEKNSSDITCLSIEKHFEPLLGPEQQQICSLCMAITGSLKTILLTQPEHQRIYLVGVLRRFCFYLQTDSM